MFFLFFVFCWKVIDLPPTAVDFHFKIRCVPFEEAEAVKNILLLLRLLLVTFFCMKSPRFKTVPAGFFRDGIILASQMKTSPEQRFKHLDFSPVRHKFEFSVYYSFGLCKRSIQRLAMQTS